MDFVKSLIRDGVLEEYYPGIYRGKDNESRKALDKILNKVWVASWIIEVGMAFVPLKSRYHRSKGSFNVTLIPGLEMNLIVNFTAMTEENLAKIGREGDIPLHIICTLPDAPVEVVHFFLGSGDVDVENVYSNFTPLMIAALKGNLDVVKFLVERGADVNKTSTLAITFTGNFGPQYEFMKIFSLKNVNPSKNEKINIPFSPLVAAVIKKELEVLGYLLKEGADANVHDEGWVALHFTALKGSFEMAEALLKSGLEVDSKDPLGTTALHKAAEKGDMALAKLLLKYGADPNSIDVFGWTPLHVSSFLSSNSSRDMVHLLLESKADINALTDSGFSPLNLLVAGYDFEFLEYFLEYMHPFNETDLGGGPVVDSDDKHLEMVGYFLKEGADLDHGDNLLGWTALHWAAASGDSRLTKILVGKYGATTVRRSKTGMTPYKTAKLFERERVAEYLNPDRNLVH